MHTTFTYEEGIVQRINFLVGNRPLGMKQMKIDLEWVDWLWSGLNSLRIWIDFSDRDKTVD
jgi:hypothetical protein